MSSYRNQVLCQLNIYLCIVCSGFYGTFYCFQGIFYSQVTASVADGQPEVSERTDTWQKVRQPGQGELQESKGF